jgi:hypothetical protein
VHASRGMGGAVHAASAESPRWPPPADAYVTGALDAVSASGVITAPPAVRAELPATRPFLGLRRRSGRC